MFSTPESARISDTWVSVQVLGGNDLDEKGASFMERYGVQGFPTLLAVTASGDLVNADLLGGQMRTADYVFAEMTKAQKANDAFTAERARLLEVSDASSMRELAKLNVERRNLPAARTILEEVVTASPDAESYEELMRVLNMLRDREAERQALDTLIADYADHERRIGWRMRRATMHVEPPADASGRDAAMAALAEGLEGLRKEVAAEGSVSDEAAVRLELAGLTRNVGDAEASQAHLDWVLEKAKDTSHELDARLIMAETLVGKGENEKAVEQAKIVLGRVEEGMQAVRAHMLLGDIAYGSHDFDGMAEHFKAVVELAPGSPWAKEAQSVLDFIERRRGRDR